MGRVSWAEGTDRTVQVKPEVRESVGGWGRLRRSERLEPSQEEGRQEAIQEPETI